MHDQENTQDTQDHLSPDTQTEKPVYKPPSRFQFSKTLIIFLLIIIFISLILLDIIIFVFPITALENAVYDVSSLFSSSKKTTTIATPSIIQLSTTPNLSPTGNPNHETINADVTYGKIEQATCQQITGYAYDPAKNEESMPVSFYMDGGLYGGTLTTTSKAQDPREDLKQTLHIQGDHGFRFTQIPQDGKEHSLYVYVTSKDGSVHQLGNTPQYLSCPQ